MNIVYAHFNTSIPDHLHLNLQRSIELFPRHNIYLVTDSFNTDINIKGLNLFIHVPTENWRNLQDSLAHPKEFRANFWFTSLSRFIAIEDFASKNPGEILHIESDVIIAEDFPFELFSNNEYLFQFPIVSDDRAIASVLYLQNHKAAEYLCNLTLSESKRNPSTTDMEILRTLSINMSKDFYPLPSAPSQRSAIRSTEENFLKANSDALEYFKGVFDGFDLGRYLFGEDPRNKRGFSRVRWNDPEVYLKARELQFSIGSSRNFPYVYDSESNAEVPIYALHIHCKKNSFFRSKLSYKLFKNAVKNSRKAPSIKLYPLVFLHSARLALMRRILKIFLTGPIK
jgi:hypothetical protein